MVVQETRIERRSGVRIFPGHTGPGDTTDRNQVKLVATITPPISGVTVYFKVWDVDDPFDQLHGPGGANDVANVSLIDNDMAGQDNRGGAHTFTMEPATTNAYGKASITLEVSMQPGDNYRAAASCLQDAVVDQVDQADADLLGVKVGSGGQYVANGGFTGYKVPVVWSPMLTVWRKLHVERDTMRVPVYTEITVTGTAGAVAADVPVAGQSTVDLGQNLPDEFSDLNLYEEGEIRFLGCPVEADTFPIVESTSTGDPFAHDSVVVLGLPGTCANGSAYILRDDDDPDVLPHYPDGGQLLIEAFGDAYILPQYAGAEYQDVVDFDLHLTENDVRFGLGSWNNEDNLDSIADFWSCFILGCWEAGQDWDADPDLCFTLTQPCEARPGWEGAQTGVTRNEYGQSAIYMQAICDDAACMQVTDEQHTVVHELGHSCGSHNGHVPDSIMQEGAPRGEHRFAAESLVVFRSEVVW